MNRNNECSLDLVGPLVAQRSGSQLVTCKSVSQLLKRDLRTDICIAEAVAYPILSVFSFAKKKNTPTHQSYAIYQHGETHLGDISQIMQGKKL